MNPHGTHIFTIGKPACFGKIGNIINGLINEAVQLYTGVGQIAQYG